MVEAAACGGAYIRACREEAGVSIDDAARILGLHFGYPGREARLTAYYRNELFMLEAGYPGEYAEMVKLLAAMAFPVDLGR